MKPTLFSGLRLRLTALYLLAGVLLVALVGGSAYGLLGYYFQSTTDLALRYAMALQVQARGAPVPAELAVAAGSWTGPTASSSGDHHDDREGDDGSKGKAGKPSDGELAAIYVLALDPAGRVVLNPGIGAPAGPADPTAAAAALAHGSDLRTVRQADGTSIRFLTYAVGRPGGPALLQLGRPLGDQERILRDMVTGLLGVGAVCVALLTGLSWWLAGRSLWPAREAWERQQAFVAGAGHELRAPLTLIRATADVALRELPADQTDQRQLWTDVLRDSDEMARLVDDLLLLARQVGRLAEERGVRLVVDRGEGAVRADPARLRQVLLVLLDNALRHTSRGGEVRLGADATDGTVRLAVSDTGEGIAPEHLPRVFERFYVVDGARRSAGSGLGLAIAKALVEAQGGEIRLTSQVGEGTRVEVALPRP